ncbi:ATP-binding cassette domain-containing protein [Marinicellulosiphila megalodicopiae]|uniref:ATP-binding cassette domain-containing protein n=1 Tax=Marinicellulosiphila megalodicopiae TaxID=2724896 RepID=UPI003BAEDD7A
MIRIEQLIYHRGTKSILNNANAQIFPGQKIALIGKNGCGKSSLFRLLLKQDQADSGEITMPSTWRISHMQQEVTGSNLTAIEYVLDADEQLKAIQHQIDNAKDDHALANAHSKMDEYGGYNAKFQAEKLLHGLGFSADEVNNTVSSFSGGWQVRLNLARALICPCDLMLLDEPTNHLDIEACYWLEKWLTQFDGTLVFVSHDRDFIDAVADQILSFEDEELLSYKGNYSAFERAKAERLAQRQQAFSKQQDQIKHIESFITRFKAKASKAKQAQSRIKELERMQMIAPAHIDGQFSFEFFCHDKQSTPLINLDKIDIGYSKDAPVIKQVNVSIEPNQRIGILGVNGSGKSTLIKTLTDQIQPISGKITHGLHLKIGYFAQHQLEDLDVTASPLLHLQRDFPDASEQALRNFLGGYGFKGDDVDKEIKNFSGGEKARLALSRISYRAPNLLLLDEPTNHLDLEIRHALTLALQNYEGAVVIISHDRHLLKNSVDEFWHVHDQILEKFDGTLEDYHKLKDQAQISQTQVNTDSTDEPVINKKDQKRLDAQRRQVLQPFKKEVEKFEKQVEKLEAKLAEIEEQLGDSELYDDSNKDKLKKLLSEQASSTQQLNEAEENWMLAQETLDEKEEALG